MDPLEQKVLQLLAEACGDPRAAADPDLDLYGENLLDSFAWVQLLEGLEDTFGLELWPTQVHPEDTATPGKLVALVRKMLENHTNFGG